MKLFLHKTDQELIKLFLDNDSRALEALVVRHKDRLYTSIILLVNNKPLAEDIFQDVLIKIINTIRAGRYKEEGKFFPWAVRIAHNLCVDHFRKSKRMPVTTTSQDRDIFELLNLNEEGADVKMMRRQSHAQVRKMLNFLSAEQCEVIIMRHYAELSFKEIASLTNCSINTALGRMRYGLININKMRKEKCIVL
jgi:RNA polymerase sigma factor (sigma-70 family)